MTDVELLREYAGFSGTPVEMRAVLLSSADHIEKLEDKLHHCFHRINELQAALRRLIDYGMVSHQDLERAQKALEGEND